MKLGVLTCLILLAGVSGMPAEMGPKPQLSLSAGTSGTWNMAWSGQDGLTYFSKWSTDLIVWKYLPGIEHDSGPKSSGFTSSSPKFFVRLFYTDIPTNDAELADFDLDGLGNQTELDLGTDPMDPDSDHDGVVDGLDPNPLSDADGDALRSGDSDGDGLSDATELLRGTSPTLWDSDGDGFGDGEDEFPLDPTRHDSPPPSPGDVTKPSVTLESPSNAVFFSGP